MVPAVVGPVRVPGLEEDHEPAYRVGRDGEALRGEGRKAEFVNELCCSHKVNTSYG